MNDPILFLLAVLVILGTPGPTNMLLATAGATVGIRRAIPLMLGESAGYFISILTIGLLVGPALRLLPVIAVSLRLIVAIYLLWLATRLWRRENTPNRGKFVVTLRHVFVTTLLNPKGIILALGIIPFANPSWPTFLLGFFVMLLAAAMAWITVGFLLGRAATAASRENIIPCIGAFAIVILAFAIVVGPIVQH